MKIISTNRESLLNIEYVDCEIERYPSVCVAITIKDGEFKGYNKDVWIELDSLKNFTENLKIMEKTCSGLVSMNSMSPDEFQIKIESYDLNGHIISGFTILADEQNYPPSKYPFI